MKKIEILGTGCPKCKKLFEAVDQAAKEMGFEYTIEKVEDIHKILKYGIMVIPALVVDGELQFAGRVPSVNDLKNFLK